MRGLTVDWPELVDSAVDTFLAGGGDGSLDQVTAEDYRELAELLDRQWLGAGLRSQHPHPLSGPPAIADRG